MNFVPDLASLKEKLSIWFCLFSQCNRLAASPTPSAAKCHCSAAFKFRTHRSTFVIHPSPSPFRCADALRLFKPCSGQRSPIIDMIEFLPETYKVEVISDNCPTVAICIRTFLPFFHYLNTCKLDFHFPSTAPSGHLREGIGWRPQLSQLPRKLTRTYWVEKHCSSHY